VLGLIDELRQELRHRVAELGAGPVDCADSRRRATSRRPTASRAPTPPSMTSWRPQTARLR